MSIKKITSKKKYEYTVPDAWNFAINMVFDSASYEYKWFKQASKIITDISYEEAIGDYNEWVQTVDEFDTGKQVIDKNGRIGYIVKLYDKTARVAYFDTDDMSVEPSYIKDLELTGMYNDSVKNLVEGR